jgi:hypothetical protein
MGPRFGLAERCTQIGRDNPAHRPSGSPRRPDKRCLPGHDAPDRGATRAPIAAVGRAPVCIRNCQHERRQWYDIGISLEQGGSSMTNQDDIALMAHLMRRAGFGASRDELEARVAKGYEATVEELLTPEMHPPVDPYVLLRHQPAALLPGGQPPMGNVNYMYYLVTTQRPLEEKMALFWHQVFATGNSKVDNYDQLLEQIDLFRHRGMGNYRDLLLTIARNPTMIFWLDNNQNEKR